MTAEDGLAFEELQKNVTTALVQTTKTVGQLAAEDLDFLRTANPAVSKALEKQKRRLLKAVRGLVRTAAKESDSTPPELQKAEHLDEGWKGLVDIIDDLLERADRCLDEYSGTVKKPGAEPATIEQNKPKSQYVNRSENITKPQRLFANPPNNHDTTPFKPLLKTKPHAKVPLEESIAPASQDEMEIDTPTDSSKPSIGTTSFKHPYATEIKEYKYPRSVYESSDPIPSQPYEGTTAVWVDTIDGVHEMLAELEQAKEIAIDLEHHETRTYIGLVSLMQISTRDKDWIVDTLKPWREELQILNEVFADPSIVKVLHGAQMDIIWLQRDLGLYIVGLFDTYHASRSLGYPRHSLAFLLTKFVNFDAQKQYQMADWRIRPLSEEMFDYARADTHFLLYVYDNMRNELLGKVNGGPALINDVLEESKKVALQRYEKSAYDGELGIGDRGWYYMLVKTPAVFNKEQFSVFKAVHNWRDRVARKDDESPSYIMQNNTLFNISRDVPSNLPDLQSHLTRKIDSLTSRVSELLKVILNAKAAGANGPEMNTFMANHPALAEYQARKAARKEAFATAARKAAANENPSMATIASQEFLKVSNKDLRAQKSSFWGPTVVEIIHPSILETSRSVIGFQVPLPDLTAEIFAGEEEFPDATTTSYPPEHEYKKKAKSAVPVAPQEEKAEEGEEVFTLKEKGGRRKRKHSERNASGWTGDDLVIGDNIASQRDFTTLKEESKLQRAATIKAELRAEKKRKRRERKMAAAAVGSDDEDFIAGDDDGKAFDYANAPSVLNAKHDPSNIKKGKHREPVLNPYAKSMDAPKGLGKKKKDIQGKSATFKS